MASVAPFIGSTWREEDSDTAIMNTQHQATRRSSSDQYSYLGKDGQFVAI